MKRDINLEDMVLLSGGANPALARLIAGLLKINLVDAKLRHFSDGETAVELLSNVRGKRVFILQSVSAPANDHLMELILMADAARRSSAADIVAVCPYLGYSRQDRRPRSTRVPISARVVADMIAGAGVARLLTMDLHSEQIQGFYSIPVDNVYAAPVLVGDIINASADHADTLIVAPDVGGVVRARAFASAVGCDLAILDKRRPRANEAKVMNVIGDVAGKNCFIVDDIVDTANTLREAAAALKRAGASRVSAYCTHGVLSGGAPERIQQSEMDELVLADTIPLSESAAKCGKIRALTVSHILAEAVARVYNQESLSSLFVE